MNQSRRRIITEKIKSVILVVLFLLTILLLYFFWEDVRFQDFSLEGLHFSSYENSEQDVRAEDVVLPNRIGVCLGNETYTNICGDVSDYWDGGKASVLDAFRAVIAQKDLFAEEITKEQYEEILSFPSLCAVFDYDLPIQEYCAFLGASGFPVSEAGASLGELAFSAGNPESMFIFDRNNGKYFRIISDYSADVLLADVQAAASSENLTYYPLETLVGTASGGRILIPSFLESDLQPIAARIVTAENGEKFNDLTEEAARSFFSGTFDFVRKIEEQSGKTIYMYGYGEKTLIADADGVIEYKAEAEQSGGDTYFAALEKAISMIDSQGGFDVGKDGSITPHLVYAGKLKNGGYRFEFGFAPAGAELYFSKGSPIAAEVTGGQVTYLKRTLFHFDADSAHGQMREASSAVNVIANHYEEIYRLLQESSAQNPVGSAQKDAHFDTVAQAVSGMQYGYVFVPEEEKLLPCYALFLNQDRLAVYFDLYTAEIIGENDLGAARQQ